MWISTCIAACLALGLATGAHALGTSDLYIGPSGNDSNPGTRARPLASLDAARDAVRSLKQRGGLPDGGVTVWIRGGAYPMKRSFRLTVEDSGTKTSPIVYRACPGERVSLTGGKHVGGFRPVTDAKMLAKLDPAARGKVLAMNLRDQGIERFGQIRDRGNYLPMGPTPLELFFNEAPMPLAGWPNKGWARVLGRPEGQTFERFVGPKSRMKRWTNLDDLWIYGAFFANGLSEIYLRATSIDPNTGIVTAVGDPEGEYKSCEFYVGCRFKVLNILEELDKPGEWYLDRKSGILYFWPPSPIRDGSAVVSILEEPVISLRDASFIEIKNLTIEYGRDKAITVNGGSDVLIAGCTVRDVGDIGINVDKTIRCGIVSCDIYDTGDAGIVLDSGDKNTLSPGLCRIENNDIHHVSRKKRTAGPGVRMRGVGNRLAHNMIHDLRRDGVDLWGNDHVIEFNELYRFGMESNDCGGIYVCHSSAQRGKVIRYNYLHDAGTGAVQSIYLDDCSCGTTVYANVLCKAGVGVLIGGGRDNTVENNIFIDCRPAVLVDARGTSWAKFWFDGTNPDLFDELKEVDYKNPPYSTRYPQLLNYVEDEPQLPKGNAIINNVTTWGMWLWTLDNGAGGVLDVRNNFMVSDPTENTILLPDDFYAYKMGFERIPIEKIGLYQDQYRVHVKPRAGRKAGE